MAENVAVSKGEMIMVQIAPSGTFTLGPRVEAVEDQEQDPSMIPQDQEMITIADGPSIKQELEEKSVMPQIPFSFPGQTFDSKCQKLILNVWDFFKRVKKNPDILEEIRTPQERAAAALHISAATIGKIGKNFKKTGKLEPPGSMRKRQKPVVDSVGPEDEDSIREIISEMRTQKITPTLPSVLAEARQRINFTGGATSFRRVLARMGYRNLSQKNIVKARVIEMTETSMSQSASAGTIQSHQSIVTPGFSALKIIKREPSVGVSSAGTTLVPIVVASSSNTTAASTSSTIQSSNLIQLGGSQQIQLSQGEGNSGTTATLLNAVQGLTGTQTIYIQQADNTIRPIQILIGNIN